MEPDRCDSSGARATTPDARDAECSRDLDPYSYQSIPLLDGSHSPGKDRSATAEQILPQDLSGKSVLDIGCSYGYFCLEAARRGAVRVLGIDVGATNIANARRFAAKLDLPVEFRQGDIERERFDESFDYVLCLNVLHFLRNPLATLERLAGITRESLLLEVAGFGASDRRNLGISRWRAALLDSSPVVYVARPGKSGRRRAQGWYFAPGALENFLMHHGNGFARPGAVASVHKGRRILIAQRRRIRELVVVAGPAGSGQASVVERLLNGSAPDLAALIGIGEPTSWTRCSASDLDGITTAAIDRLVVCSDLPGLSQDFGNGVLDLARTAQRVTFVTVTAPPEVLRQRFAARSVSFLTRRGWLTQGRRYRRIQRSFEDAEQVATCYAAWSESLHLPQGSREITVSLGDEVSVLSDRERPGTRCRGALAHP